jgi:hypothetical protein
MPKGTVQRHAVWWSQPPENTWAPDEFHEIVPAPQIHLVIVIGSGASGGMAA